MIAVVPNKLFLEWTNLGSLSLLIILIFMNKGTFNKQLSSSVTQ